MVAKKNELIAKVRELDHQKQWSEAIVVARELLKDTKVAFGTDHFKVAVVLGILSGLHRQLGEIDEAAAKWREALAIIERDLGPDYPYVPEVVDLLREFYFDHGGKAIVDSAGRRAGSVIGKEWVFVELPSVGAQLPSGNKLVTLGRGDHVRLIFRCENDIYRNSGEELQVTLSCTVMLEHWQGFVSDDQPSKLGLKKGDEVYFHPLAVEEVVEEGAKDGGEKNGRN